MTVSEWANSYLKLPQDAAEPGQYKTTRTPYVTEIMNSFTQPNIKKIVFKSAAQVGKSQLLLAIVGRYVHLDPCNLMIVQPTLDTAQDFSKTRLEKMIQDTPILTPLFQNIGKSRVANQTILNKTYKGGRIVLVGANSPAGLASRPIRVLLCDEVDRFADSAGNEGDVVSLAEKRQTTYWNRKTALFSTPTVEGISRIDREYLLGTQEQWQHKCPNCGEYHFLEYQNMVADYVEHFDEYKNRVIVVKDVLYRCPDCGQSFTEIEMKNAPQKYFAQNLEALKNGIRSFHVTGFSSTFLNWITIMQEYLEARGDPTREAVVYNTRFGISYELKGEYADENEFLKRREEYPARVPEGVLILTAGVDVQNNRLEYLIAGWGVDEEFYGIERGIVRGSPHEVATWQNLDDILDKEYQNAAGKKYKIARTFIDSGYATSTVYEYCRKNQVKGRFPIKGTGIIGAPLIYQYSYPKNAGVILTILGVNNGKQEIFSRLGVDKGNSQYMHFPKNEECGFDEVFFKQLIAERRVIKKSGGLLYSVFEPVAAKERNEALDMCVYALGSLKSCIGEGDAAKFWSKLQEEKPVAQVKKVKASRSVNIW